jgi:hypothetical protein
MTAVLLAQAPQPSTQPPTRDTTPSAHSIDGTWTVLCFEKNGQAVPEAKNMTITIRNNVATCSGDEKSRPKAMRLEFGQNGMIRVTELDTTVGTEPGRPPEPARPGAGRPDAGPPNADQPDAGRPNAAGDARNAKTGHYILAKEFFCVCLKDGQSDGARPGGGAIPPAASRIPGEQPVRPAGGADNTQPGTFGTTVPAGKPDAVVIILKKSDGSSPGERRP